MSVAVWTTLRGGGTSSLVSSTRSLHNQNKKAYAHGIVVRRAGDDPTWPDPTESPASPTPTTSQPNADAKLSSNNGPSSDAKIGVEVGGPLGLLLTGGSAAAAFLLGKRRARPRKNEEADHQAGSEEPSKSLPVEACSTTHYVEVAGADDDAMCRHPGELSAYREPAELDTMVRRRTSFGRHFNVDRGGYLNSIAPDRGVYYLFDCEGAAPSRSCSTVPMTGRSVLLA